MEDQCPARMQAGEWVEDSSGLFRVGEMLLMCPQEEQEAELSHAVWSFTHVSKNELPAV